MRIIQVTAFFLLLITAAGMSQTRWKRSDPAPTKLQLFHSMHAASLPTAETMKKGNWLFEVSHRFSTPINEGGKAFFGFDGPANVRLALGYGVTKRLFLLVGRTNANDNVELVAKYKAFEWRNKNAPLLVSFRGGVAYNAQTFASPASDSRLYQFYAQAILNTMLQKKLGVGVVPTYLHNADIFSSNVEYVLTLGGYAQYYVSRRLSFLVEWNPTISGRQPDDNSLTFGLELETGGHFFKVFVANNDKINTSQFIAGVNNDFYQSAFRFGFMITRTF